MVLRPNGADPAVQSDVHEVSNAGRHCASFDADAGLRNAAVRVAPMEFESQSPKIDFGRDQTAPSGIAVDRRLRILPASEEDMQAVGLTGSRLPVAAAADFGQVVEADSAAVRADSAELDDDSPTPIRGYGVSGENQCITETPSRSVSPMS